ncbi:discoidin-like protein [Heterostelium album PN500]|uniref:Discoidin-like protein n=1 Tax=Heterostelium pallidum (strain ATCC 26659 / Pp 5 / PN500) TaxID=670386 RepID=D3BDB1_HETP5|nr:hypothetical protein PPL_06494 [Heterostelium album PN500]XP_020432712.1 discoidin-like protein [Heterostelium album PN500]EFA80555.1 hypothetical protein PPL_06494 [Heterostelium album PN500]EFA80592.1 discoidin-like protein [Heterostelium album PN500]|eukprot:XP_020432675.1 hypothetical protein PPL_06494 [Heterostelium album PN500]
MSKLIIILFALIFITTSNAWIRGGISGGLLNVVYSSFYDINSMSISELHSRSGWTPADNDNYPTVVAGSDDIKHFHGIGIRIPYNYDMLNASNNPNSGYVTKMKIEYSLNGIHYKDYGVVETGLNHTTWSYFQIVYLFKYSYNIYGRSIKIEPVEWVGNKPSMIMEVIYYPIKLTQTGTVRSLDPIFWQAAPNGVVREFKKKVYFETPFVAPPKVAISINTLSSSKESSTIISVAAQNVTRSDFIAVFGTWGDAVFWDVISTYVATMDEQLYYPEQLPNS